MLSNLLNQSRAYELCYNAYNAKGNTGRAVDEHIDFQSCVGKKHCCLMLKEVSYNKYPFTGDRTPTICFPSSALSPQNPGKEKSIKKGLL